MARVAIALALIVTIPAILLRLQGIHLAPGLEAVVFGVAILGAAFLLTWGSEVAELDIAQGLALAFLALVAVLPEYAVDLYFAWQAPHHPAYTAYATANMTGANRLLIGIAWPLIIVLNWWHTRRRELVLPASRSVELTFLGIATAYSFVIPLKQTISLWDSVFLVGLFAAYMWRIARASAEEPELVGPAAVIALLRPRNRRIVVFLIFIYGAICIVDAAEPFAEALVHMGKNLGMDEFLLVQWLAPLASEAPEVVIACILTARGDSQAGMGAMISAKVNQWTLLIGTLAVIYSVSAGQPGALQLDARQTEEILLTASQSAFAVAVLANLRLSLIEAGALFVLFAIQFFYPQTEIRYLFSAVYIGLTLLVIMRHRDALPELFRTSMRGTFAKSKRGTSKRH
jgi:cation:H+ antiporter